jgi:hypothetical protein
MNKTNWWGVGAGLLLAGLALSGPGRPWHSAVGEFPGWTAAIALASAAAVGFARSRAGLERGFAWVGDVPRARFNLGLFAVAFLAYAGVAWFTFKGIPRIDDGLASLFQARIFAGGALTLPLPDDAGFAPIFGILGKREGLVHWCGMYPPGWPALLVPGVWLRVPWLVNPLLGALLVVAIAELGRDLFGTRVGRAAALLALPSPFLAVLSGLHLSNIPTTLFLCLALLALRKLWATGRWIWGGAAGGAWGVAFLCRPLDAAVLGALFALAFLFPAKRLGRCRLGIAAGLAAALLAIGAMLGFQEITTGDWATPGHEVGMGSRGQFGFVQLTPFKTHTPATGWEHTGLRLRALNDNLLGWPWPALAVALLPFLLGRARTKEWLLLLPLPALLGAFACFWYYETEFPARYVSAATPYLFILAARGLFMLREAAANRPVPARLPAFLAVSGTLFLAISLPAHFRRYDADYYDVEEVLPRVVRDYGIANAIVFMDAVGLDHGERDVDNDYYATGFMRNALDLRGDVLYVRNFRERNVELLRRHPGRSAYLYRYVRDREKALLYRMRLAGEEFELEPVEPRTPDLLPAPPAN